MVIHPVTRLETNELYTSSKIKLDFPSGPVLGICLPMQGPWVPSLGTEDPTRRGAADAVLRNERSHAQQGRPKSTQNKQAELRNST